MRHRSADRALLARALLRLVHTGDDMSLVQFVQYLVQHSVNDVLLVKFIDA
jgi:hypothetical protein